MCNFIVVVVILVFLAVERKFEKDRFGISVKHWIQLEILQKKLASAKEHHFVSNLEASKTVVCCWVPAVIEWTEVLSLLWGPSSQTKSMLSKP
jgi:hypothetical protein